MRCCISVLYTVTQTVIPYFHLTRSALIEFLSEKKEKKARLFLFAFFILTMLHCIHSRHELKRWSFEVPRITTPVLHAPLLHAVSFGPV